MSNPQSFDSKINNNSIANGANSAGDGERSRRTVVRDTHGMVSTAPPAEIAVLVGVDIDIMPSLLPLEDSLDELALLAKTADLQVAGRITQRLEAPTSGHADRLGQARRAQAAGHRAGRQCRHL